VRARESDIGDEGIGPRRLIGTGPSPEIEQQPFRRQCRDQFGRMALAGPFRAFPSWFLRIECDRCGKVSMLKRGARTGSCQCDMPPPLQRAIVPPFFQTSTADFGQPYVISAEICLAFFGSS
jgi:hypothetical protein